MLIFPKLEVLSEHKDYIRNQRPPFSIKLILGPLLGGRSPQESIYCGTIIIFFKSVKFTLANKNIKSVNFSLYFYNDIGLSGR